MAVSITNKYEAPSQCAEVYSFMMPYEKTLMDGGEEERNKQTNDRKGGKKTY